MTSLKQRPRMEIKQGGENVELEDSGPFEPLNRWIVEVHRTKRLMLKKGQLQELARVLGEPGAGVAAVSWKKALTAWKG